jgi:hypothetical protein
MEAGEEDKEEEVPGVRIQCFIRDDGSGSYSLNLEQTVSVIVTQPDGHSTSIGWCFPDGSSSLDRVEVDGTAHEADALDRPMKQTGLREGSIVKVYRTALSDDEDDDDQ